MIVRLEGPTMGGAYLSAVFPLNSYIAGLCAPGATPLEGNTEHGDTVRLVNKIAVYFSRKGL